MDVNFRENPYTQSNNRMALAALILGVLGLFTIPTLYLPLILGSLAILFAVLSKGYGKKMTTTAKIGFFTGIGSLAVIISIIALAVTAIVALFTSLSSEELIEFGRTADAQIEQQLGASTEEIFGVSYEDLMEAYTSQSAE